MSKNNRNSKYEFLRIIAAAMIILNHINVRFDHDANMICDFNSIILSFFKCGGKLGVTVFVLISAMFLSESKFSFKRIIRVVIDVFFYSIIAAILSFGIFKTQFSFGALIHGFSYWFPFAYLVMIIMIPFINKLSKSWLTKLFILGCILFSFVFLCSLFFHDTRWFHYLTIEYFIGPVWFCYVYIFVLLFKDRINNISNTKLMGLCFVVSYIVIFLIKHYLLLDSVRDMYSPLCLFSSLALFSFFVSINDFHSRIINIIATGTFGTYLFQCNNNFNYIYDVKIFNFDFFFEKSYFIIWCFVAVVLTFFIVCLLESLKKWLLNLFQKKK